MSLHNYKCSEIEKKERLPNAKFSEKARIAISYDPWIAIFALEMSKTRYELGDYSLIADFVTGLALFSQEVSGITEGKDEEREEDCKRKSHC